ncbi:MAG: DUF418 domain-containing protein [Chloroflexota bacterium]|nr:DUF418 domain-containing protein [Gammaproteobacteria bacterium]MDE2687319.1 DUF418 domain-containing protein [Chloroflexota bacterium]
MDELRATAVQERIPLLDVLRGFALIGIFLANLVSFFGYYYLDFGQVKSLPLIERVVLFAVDWLVEGKFYALFSFLLGAGFALQLERARLKGVPFLPFWYRRMGVLLLIGLIHMYFIWYGDILTLYALLGFLLPLFLSWSSRQLFIAIAILLALPMAIHAVTVATADAAFWSSSARFAAELRNAWGLEGQSTMGLLLSDQARDVWLANILGALQRPMSYLLSGRYVQVLGFFLLGALFTRLVLPLWRNGQNVPTRWWVASMLAGLLSSAAYAWTKALTTTPYSADVLGLFQGLVYHIGCVTLMLGYVGAAAWLWQHGTFKSLLSQLAVLGRMPLTSYVTQTVLGVLLFYGYGAGLLGKLPYTLLPPLAAIVIFLQWAFATFWLQRYDQGPLEAFWRNLSYGPPRERLS